MQTSKSRSDKNKFGNLEQEDKDSLKKSLEYTADKAQEYMEAGWKKISDVPETVKDYSHEFINQVREKPLTSLLIAGGVGFILSTVKKMIKFIEHLEGRFSSQLNIAKGIWELFKLESELAGLSIAPLLIYIGLLVALLFSTWLTAVVLIAYLIILATGGYVLISIGVVLIISVCFLLFVIKRIKTNIRQMSFEKTRACLTNNKPRDTHELQK